MSAYSPEQLRHLLAHQANALFDELDLPSDIYPSFRSTLERYVAWKLHPIVEQVNVFVEPWEGDINKGGMCFLYMRMEKWLVNDKEIITREELLQRCQKEAEANVKGPFALRMREDADPRQERPPSWHPWSQAMEAMVDQQICDWEAQALDQATASSIPASKPRF